MARGKVDVCNSSFPTPSFPGPSLAHYFEITSSHFHYYCTLCNGTSVLIAVGITLPSAHHSIISVIIYLIVSTVRSHCSWRKLINLSKLTLTIAFSGRGWFSRDLIDMFLSLIGLFSDRKQKMKEFIRIKEVQFCLKLFISLCNREKILFSRLH